jgi:hypothetical protein
MSTRGRYRLHSQFESKDLTFSNSDKPPPEAIETKRKLLAEGDSLLDAVLDIINYYAAPDIRPPSLYNEALGSLSGDFREMDKEVRRELTDLYLEYGK